MRSSTATWKQPSPRSDLIVETDYHTTFQEHATLERDATLGYIDEMAV